MAIAYDVKALNSVVTRVQKREYGKALESFLVTMEGDGPDLIAYALIAVAREIYELAGTLDDALNPARPATPAEPARPHNGPR